MRDPFDRIMAAILAQRQRTASRRRFFSGSVKVAGGAALALTWFGGPFARTIPSVAGQDFADDVELANFVLTLEHLEAAFYRDGLAALDEDAFRDAKRPASVFDRLEDIRDQELDHVDELIKIIDDLGGTPVEEGIYEFGYDDVDSFLKVAAALESAGVAAYAGAVPQIQDPGLLETALGIHSVEARHAAYLNARVEASPFPDAIDEALDPNDVLEIIGQFILPQ